MKKIILAAVPFFILGCSDKPKEEQKTTADTTQSASKIEIVENKNAHEIKIEKKALDKNDSDAYYYDYNKEKKEVTKEEEARTKVDAYSHLRSPYEAVEIRMMASKLSKDFIVKCSPCHDDYANGIIGPSLLSRDGEFIFQRIIDYKNGTKVNPLMTDLVKLMSDEQLKNIADEIAMFNIKIKEMREGK